MSDNANSQIYSSYATSICASLLPLFIGLTSTNKVEGLVTGIMGVVALIGLPMLYARYMSKCTDKSVCFLEQGSNSSLSFSVAFVIIVMAMLVTNR
jgi:hypothetical protein